MGAGRSGTTALGTFLGNNKHILHIGEAHQFFDHLDDDRLCSCGKKLNKCDFWEDRVFNQRTISRPSLFESYISQNRELTEKIESHRNIIKHIFASFNKSDILQYNQLQQSIIEAVFSDNKNQLLLDSSKYIGRALALNRLHNYNLKVIYVVRDVRGVINSFSKQVQTSKSPISTIMYYLFVNIAAEFVKLIFFRKKIIKIRYEDLINQPFLTLEKLENFLQINLKDVKKKIEKEEPFSVGHIIGGNRLKKNKEIYFRKRVFTRTDIFD